MTEQARPRITPLAQHILEWAYAQTTFYGRSNEDCIYHEFQTRGYDKATIYLALVELYRVGYISRITYH